MTNLGRRLEKLEAANDRGAVPLYIFKWEDESEAAAIANWKAKNNGRDPFSDGRKVCFFQWGASQ